MEQKTKIRLIGLLLMAIVLAAVWQKEPLLRLFLRIKPASRVDCFKEADYFLSQYPGYFENIEKGAKWCNQCLDNNGIPTLSRDIGPFCNLETTDAGKDCLDFSQCQGVCLSENKNSRSGKCSDTESVPGCVFEMEGGKSLEVCFD